MYLYVYKKVGTGSSWIYCGIYKFTTDGSIPTNQKYWEIKLTRKYGREVFDKVPMLRTLTCGTTNPASWLKGPSRASGQMTSSIKQTICSALRDAWKSCGAKMKRRLDQLLWLSINFQKSIYSKEEHRMLFWHRAATEDRPCVRRKIERMATSDAKGQWYELTIQFSYTKMYWQLRSIEEELIKGRDHATNLVRVLWHDTVHRAVKWFQTENKLALNFVRGNGLVSKV